MFSQPIGRQSSQRPCIGLRICMAMDDTPTVAPSAKHHGDAKLLLRPLRPSRNIGFDDLLLNQVSEIRIDHPLKPRLLRTPSA